MDATLVEGGDVIFCNCRTCVKLDFVFSIGCLEIKLEAFLDSILTQWQPFMFCDISVRLSTDGNVNIAVWISI